jgi:hypothetical protein
VICRISWKPLAGIDSRNGGSESFDLATSISPALRGLGAVTDERPAWWIAEMRGPLRNLVDLSRGCRAQIVCNSTALAHSQFGQIVTVVPSNFVTVNPENCS